jgi:hypothetical protein
MASPLYTASLRALISHGAGAVSYRTRGPSSGPLPGGGVDPPPARPLRRHATAGH